MLSTAVVLAAILSASGVSQAKARFRVECEGNHMTAIVEILPEMERLYLDRLKHFPVCRPEIRDSRAIFHINLADVDQFSTCGVTKVLNRITGERTYYHHVIVEYTDRVKESLRLMCTYSSNGTSDHPSVEAVNIVKRSAQSDPWPSGFQEPEILEITDEITATAPTPELSVLVRQDGEVIDTSLNVRPGAPLEMEIFLDTKSAGTYGIIVSDMIVSDTKTQEELLLTNGCSVDPFLFGNFATETGDSLRAKFRAFKFPQTNYVLFKGILNVCIDSCEGVLCSNGEQGYGRRRRRALSQAANDPNQVFQVTMTTILNVVFDDEEKQVQAGFLGGQFEEPFSVGYVEPMPHFAGALTQGDEEGRELSEPPIIHQAGSSAPLVHAPAAALLLALLVNL